MRCLLVVRYLTTFTLGLAVSAAIHNGRWWLLPLMAAIGVVSVWGYIKLDEEATP